MRGKLSACGVARSGDSFPRCTAVDTIFFCCMELFGCCVVKLCMWWHCGVLSQRKGVCVCSAAGVNNVGRQFSAVLGLVVGLAFKLRAALDATYQRVHQDLFVQS